MVNQENQGKTGENNNVDMALMVEKVAADIAFLEDKLKYMDSQRTPNQAVIKVYKDMLMNREGVRDWLSRNSVSCNDNSSNQTAINH